MKNKICALLIALSFACVFLIPLTLSVGAQASTSPAETAGPLTATEEFRLGCKVQYILVFNTDRNVRRVPFWKGASATPDNRSGTVNEFSGPVHAVEVITDHDGTTWYQLCQKGTGWIVYDERFMTVASVTPTPVVPTLTPGPTLTPRPTNQSQIPTAAVTPTRLVDVFYCASVGVETFGSYVKVSCLRP